MELSAWVSAMATVIIAFATIVYVIVTKETLRSIKSQIEIVNRQLLENIRANSLMIQPIITIGNVKIKINHFTKHREDWMKDWLEYSGTLSITFQVSNPGFGTAICVTLLSVLIATREDEHFYMGFFSQTIPAIEKQQSVEIICNDVDGLSYAMINHKVKYDPPTPSYKIIIFALYQDISSQSHVQYQIFSHVPSILYEKFLSRYESASNIFHNTLEELAKSHDKEINFQEKDTMISAVPVDHLDNIILSKMSTVSPILLTDDLVFIKELPCTSVLVSRGLPDPLKTDKIFDTLKSKLALGVQKSKTEKEIIEVIVKMFTNEKVNCA